MSSSRPSAPAPRHGLARVLSKLGFCSRAEAFRLIQDGRVSLDGRICRNPEQPARAGLSVIQIDGKPVVRVESVYLMLNKPRGLVTTAHDERNRPTVFDCLQPGSGPAAAPTLPDHLMAVGRLDQASEGLLLLTNDSTWANALTDPTSGPPKIYHVQINRVADAGFCQRLLQGALSEGEFLRVHQATILRTADRTCWLEITLKEGRNRHLRRLLGALEVEVLRLVRVQIGSLTLGALAKASWRFLTPEEARRLHNTAKPAKDSIPSA